MLDQKNFTIVLDARMINISGIGRYIQILIPSLVDNFKRLILLGNSFDLEKFSWYGCVEVVEVNSPIYSIKEQYDFLIKTPKCDIFIAPHYNVPIFLPQAEKIAVIIPDTNHLVFGENLSFLKRLYASIFYKIAAGKNYVFTISDFSKSEIVKFTKSEPDKIIVAKCAISKNYFKELLDNLKIGNIPLEVKQHTNSRYILYIGNIKPHKNLKRALAAFEKVSITNKDLKFLIVGKKNNFLTGDNEIFELVETNNNLKKRVEFTGHISDLCLAFLYKNAQLFLFPSLYEGFGLPPLEAMFFGCPVIVSREGSLPEICGDAAYYCDAYSIDDIANALEEVLSNDVLRESLVEKGYKRNDEFDWSIFKHSIIESLKRN